MRIAAAPGVGYARPDGNEHRACRPPPIGMQAAYRPAEPYDLMQALCICDASRMLGMSLDREIARKRERDRALARLMNELP